MIYDLCFDFSYALRHVNTNRDPPYDLDRQNYDWVTTPSLLLLNHQVHAEASEVLYNKELVVDGACQTHYFIRCFSKTMLQKIRHVTLNIDLSSFSTVDHTFHHNWIDLCMLLSLVWGEGHGLKTFRLTLGGSEEKISAAPFVAFHGIRELIKALFKCLPKMNPIPEVAVSGAVDWLPGQLSCKEYVVHSLRMYTKSLKGESPDIQLLCWRDFLKGECRFDTSKFLKVALLSPEFMGWWYPLDKKSLDIGKERPQILATAQRLDEFMVLVNKVGLMS